MNWSLRNSMDRRRRQETEVRIQNVGRPPRAAAGPLARLLLAAAVSVSVGCVRQVRTSAMPGATSGVTQTMGKQIQNAIDAGDGDLEARAMRQRLAANADDLEARLALAKRYLQRGLPDLALEHYRLAAVRFPDSIPVAFGIAKTLRELSQQEQALVSLQAFL